MAEQHWAFPSTSSETYKGLTKREWLAGQALAGLAGNRELSQSDIVRIAYELADKMVAKSERNDDAHQRANGTKTQ